ncbi:MAG TPA: 50S ribosomal protein L10 [Clostridiales bacterium]|nr:50S ribosomal protein L10 [Clostridiales bacterium]
MPSNKVLDAKKEVVAGLAQELKNAQSIVFADYRGLTVEQDTAMRAALRKAGVSYRVVKNTLSKRALEVAGVNGLDEILQGPTAIAFSTTDIVAAAKVVKEYAGKFDKLTVKGGVLENKVINPDDVARLAAIPSKDVLYGQVVFGLVSPIASLAVLLNAIKEKLESGNSVAETEPVSASV